MATFRKLLILISTLVPSLALADVTVTDDRGLTVSLEQPANQVASLMPHSTDMLAHLGAEDEVAGILDYPDVPEPLSDRPRLGDYFSLSLEAIVQLDPDLIIAWPSTNIASQIERLQELGYPIFFSDPQSITDIAETYQRLGTLIDRPDEGQRIAQVFLDGMDALRAEYGERPPVSVFYQTWDDPLYTINGNNFIGRVISLCGGANPFSDAGPLAPQVSREAVLNAGPDVIITGGDSPAQLDYWRQHESLPAVRNHQLRAVDTNLTARPTRTLLQGAQELCTIIDEARKTRYTN